MTKYKYGDFVVARVTEYRRHFEADPLSHVTPATPVWVAGVFSQHKDFDISEERILVAPEFTGEELEAMDWDGHYSLSRDCDKWELVPEKDWPGEVCAALAKTALLGDE